MDPHFRLLPSERGVAYKLVAVIAVVYIINVFQHNSNYKKFALASAIGLQVSQGIALWLGTNLRWVNEVGAKIGLWD
jgi:hypothetical protein